MEASMISLPKIVRRVARHAAAVAVLLSIARAEEPAGPALIPAPPAPSRPDKLTELDTPEGRLGYALGLRIGGRIAADFKEQGTDVDPGSLARGLADAILGAQPLLGEEELARALDRFDRAMQARDEAFRADWAGKAKANRDRAVEFLSTNARRRGIRTMPSGLQYEVLSKGSGPQAKHDGTVSLHFVGRHADGREFDRTTAERGPAVVALADTIRGWQESVPLMAAGSKWRLFIPPELAYGEQGRPPEIEPNELLVFELEVVSVADEPAKE
jgi:FKBP-type peptidyl-prolyl cis-trans isomerase FklB